MTQPQAPGAPTAADPADIPAAARPVEGAFTRGSTLRHVLVMTAAGSAGLISIFVVDFLNLVYISLLGEQELAAAVGYAGSVFFFLMSVGIGIAIAITAVVSRAIGARDRERARRLAASGLAFTTVASVALTIVAMFAANDLLTLLGASGRTHALAHRYLMFTLPFQPFLGLGMAFGGLLRSVGDAKRAMWVTLGGGFVAAIADPIFIFAFSLGLDGAAVAANLSKLAIAWIGFHGTVRVHHLVARPTLADIVRGFVPLSAIAGPAVLTNIATPVANGYVTAALAPFGDAAVAAWAVIGRLIPVAFGAVFALSGAIGPIIGQNLGARQIDRVRRTLMDSLVLTSIYVLAMWGLIALAQDQIVAVFAASGEAASLIRFYCSIVAGTFLFMGALFVANAAFNTLGSPLFATVFNWGRATLGTIPFATYGGQVAGAQGVLLGQGLGAVLFGIGAVLCAFWVIGRLSRRHATAPL